MASRTAGSLLSVSCSLRARSQNLVPIWLPHCPICSVMNSRGMLVGINRYRRLYQPSLKSRYSDFLLVITISIEWQSSVRNEESALKKVRLPWPVGWQGNRLRPFTWQVLIKAFLTLSDDEKCNHHVSFLKDFVKWAFASTWPFQTWLGSFPRHQLPNQPTFYYLQNFNTVSIASLNIWEYQRIAFKGLIQIIAARLSTAPRKKSFREDGSELFIAETYFVFCFFTVKRISPYSPSGSCQCERST